MGAMVRSLPFIVSAAAILCISGCSAPQISNLDSAGKGIVCFGNSITSGASAEGGDDYPAQLGRLLGRGVVNAGVPGDTTDTALARLGDVLQAHEPYLVIVELGGNDFLNRVPKEETLKNLEAIITMIQSAGAMTALCDVSSGFLFSGYRADYKKLARTTGSVLIPGLLRGILENPSLKSDQIHPNARGYAIIAGRVHQVIRRYVKQANPIQQGGTE